ncbi:MAG: prepilin-type N-terminal cleavage/methylation domain-containing protein [Chloroflexi bacterium]|nr:prepilin-type N-terminal cleavage/methylation domain-containing protein [Chloroflexota bacterium]
MRRPGYRRREDGFTLIELVISMAVASVLALGITGAIFQVLRHNELTDRKIQVTAQVENAAYWLGKDSLVAQTIVTGPSAGLPLTLSWQGVNDNNNQVVYSVSGSSLRRAYSVNGGAPGITLIAANLDLAADKTSVTYADGVLNIQITSAISTTSETRTFPVKTRIDQPSS